MMMMMMITMVWTPVVLVIINII